METVTHNHFGLAVLFIIEQGDVLKMSCRG